MSSYWSTSSTTSSSSTTWGTQYYNYNYAAPQRVNSERPLAHLKAAEDDLKETREAPPAMPEDKIMFDPEELVLGGETGWKKL